MAAINLSGLTKAAPKKAKQEKPLLPDPTGELTPLVAKAITAKQHIEAHNVVLDQVKATIGSAALGYVFRHYQGRSDVEDTLQIGTAEGKAVVSLKNAYKLPENLDEVRAVLGDKADEILKDAYSITIDADAIPVTLQQTFVDELIKLARGMDELSGTPEGEDGPCFKAITATVKTTVDKAFHEGRHRLFNPEQNMAIHRVMPCVISMRLEY